MVSLLENKNAEDIFHHSVDSSSSPLKNLVGSIIGVVTLPRLELRVEINART